MNQDNRFLVAIGSQVVFWASFGLIVASCGTSQTPTKMGTTVEYDRDSWGRWIDADGDCQDTRQEVLIRDSQEPPTMDAKGCRVLTGKWVDPYTGKTFTDPGQLDIDHVVPLKEAHDSGAATWDEAQKVAYFNHLGGNNLRAVDQSANRSKGSRQPHEWLPLNESFRCQYLKDWLNIKRQWNLETDCEEAQKLATLVSQYCF